MNSNKHESEQPKGQFLVYQAEDGKLKLDVRFEDESVWLSQRLMAELFQKDVRTINEHIQNVYDEGELVPEATVRKFRIVQKEGKREVSRMDDDLVTPDSDQVIEKTTVDLVTGSDQVNRMPVKCLGLGFQEDKPLINANERKCEEENDSRPFASIGGSNSYHRESFAANVSEGKDDPIYNAYSYHTKAPCKVIVYLWEIAA